MQARAARTAHRSARAPAGLGRHARADPRRGARDASRERGYDGTTIRDVAAPRRRGPGAGAPLLRDQAAAVRGGHASSRWTPPRSCRGHARRAARADGGADRRGRRGAVGPARGAPMLLGIVRSATTDSRGRRDVPPDAADGPFLALAGCRGPPGCRAAGHAGRDPAHRPGHGALRRRSWSRSRRCARTSWLRWSGRRIDALPAGRSGGGCRRLTAFPGPRGRARFGRLWPMPQPDADPDAAALARDPDALAARLRRGRIRRPPHAPATSASCTPPGAST